ncbi:glycosyltransferase family 92 protein Os08g0121900-like [Diospyros lotus]|uniref:glycosyltransferase family 92 protein Os08g0121900-like n=1 Tax=Diospyros lotus TaxID=55363 RepID=UPI00225259A6|nr:glycosyltransferase family 92 protein Os08g0121900-like [Diospyros lotus]
MARKVRSIIVGVVALFLFLGFFANQRFYWFHRHPIISGRVLRSPPVILHPEANTANLSVNYQDQDQEREEEETARWSSRNITTVADSVFLDSVLLPAWEILVIVSPPGSVAGQNYTCLFPSNDTSPARTAGTLSSPDRKTFTCDFPERLRRRIPFLQPILTPRPESPPDRRDKESELELLRWNFLVYNSFTASDVVLFVKGLNHRQGINRAPNKFKCVFGEDVDNGVRTAVTSSAQEVFRCQRPELTAFNVSPYEDEAGPMKVTIEIPERRLAVPSVAYYTPPLRIAVAQQKQCLCACTMVYNAAKFLKEWVMYHSAIGIEKFVIYDNGSDDDLEEVVGKLVKQGYNLVKLIWVWPKAQEAGFSHCAINFNDSCSWMMFTDVDEFVYSPSWLDSNASRQMLKSLLPNRKMVGQVMISCREFGPSNQRSHPAMGVTQGYNCRRRGDNRHKSIVRLDAIDESLLNVVHHFKLKEGYRAKKLRTNVAVVNHYKFQAWPEFETKFRRRVSTYVRDWMEERNRSSKDRTPGLGNEPVQPEGWPGKFCQVYDNNLKDLTARWFAVESPSSSSSSGYHMAWQRLI